jgi:hypothetical protein
VTTFGVCLVLAAKAAVSGHQPVFVATERFTLAWTHSIEKVRWEEDYAVRLAAPGQAPVLMALSARVRGSAAGMEPPAEAVLRNGWYHYTPANTAPGRLTLSRSEFLPDYELCTASGCRSLSHWLPSDGGVTQLSACTGQP